MTAELAAQQRLDLVIEECGQDPRLTELAGLVSGVSVTGLITAIPALLPRLQSAEAKLELLDALTQACARAKARAEGVE